MSTALFDWIGWVATATFATSYAFKKPQTLRLVQALGAAIWIVYGIAMKSAPVIVANILVVAMATFSARKQANA